MKMKTRVNMLLISIFTVLIFSGCGNNSQNTSSSLEGKNVSTDKQEDMTVQETEKSEIVEKYSELLSMLEKEDYDSSIEYINMLKLEKIKEEAGDIADYLVTVELTDDNFEEYFECAKIRQYNAFGEEEVNEVGLGLKSKVYDEGLILYDGGDISVELLRNGMTDEYSLSDLLNFVYSIGGESITYDSFATSFVRVTPGTLIFIKSDYILSYEIEETKNTNAETTIILMNGEVINRYVNPEYLY